MLRLVSLERYSKGSCLNIFYSHPWLEIFIFTAFECQSHHTGTEREVREEVEGRPSKVDGQSRHMKRLGTEAT